jgi:hypothetical protein
MLAPRMTETERLNIETLYTPAEGLLVYQIPTPATDTSPAGFYYWDGSDWKSFGSGGVGTDEQELSINGYDLSISGGNTITLPSGGGGSGSYTFTNGLTDAGGTVKLGGTLIESTELNLDSKILKITGATRTIFETGSELLPDDFIQFGGYRYFTTVPSMGVYQTSLFDDGYEFTDSAGDDYELDFIAGFRTTNANTTNAEDGTGGGSAVLMGSIEFLVDGSREILTSHTFSPFTDPDDYDDISDTEEHINLGSATHRWHDIYSKNTVTSTSDIRLKKNIKELTYGLDQVLKLKTITYNWKNNKIGKTTMPENLQETKMGFSAQQLLEVLPEAVNTHSWVPDGESGNYKRVENKYLGVSYSDIIPVTVKAIQEQQEIIEAQNKKLESLEAQILELKNMVNTLISAQK